jgi:O-methyltransferase involved in polyketide biosynthesis
MTGRGSRTPNVGRIYDALLGGKDNYAEDRQAASELMVAIPDIVTGARANREFLGRAVRFLAGEAGIRQFIDIGAGLPTMGNSHAVAHEVAPDARVAYVDIDPVVISHARGLLAGTIPEVCAIQGDLRDPAGIVDHPDLKAHIDLRQPAAILLVAVLHFIPDGEDPYRAVSFLTAAMAPGSYLVVSHGTGDNLGPDAVETMQKVYAGATAPAAPRSEAGIALFFDGLQMVHPGLCDVASWRAVPHPGQPGRVLFLGGIGRKR